MVKLIVGRQGLIKGHRVLRADLFPVVIPVGEGIAVFLGDGQAAQRVAGGEHLIGIVQLAALGVKVYPAGKGKLQLPVRPDADAEIGHVALEAVLEHFRVGRRVLGKGVFISVFGAEANVAALLQPGYIHGFGAVEVEIGAPAAALVAVDVQPPGKVQPIHLVDVYAAAVHGTVAADAVAAQLHVDKAVALNEHAAAVAAGRIAINVTIGDALFCVPGEAEADIQAAAILAGAVPGDFAPRDFKAAHAGGGDTAAAGGAVAADLSAIHGKAGCRSVADADAAALIGGAVAADQGAAGDGEAGVLVNIHAAAAGVGVDPFVVRNATVRRRGLAVFQVDAAAVALADVALYAAAVKGNASTLRHLGVKARPVILRAVAADAAALDVGLAAEVDAAAALGAVVTKLPAGDGYAGPFGRTDAAAPVGLVAADRSALQAERRTFCHIDAAALSGFAAGDAAALAAVVKTELGALTDGDDAAFAAAAEGVAVEAQLHLALDHKVAVQVALQVIAAAVQSLSAAGAHRCPSVMAGVACVCRRGGPGKNNDKGQSHCRGRYTIVTLVPHLPLGSPVPTK